MKPKRGTVKNKEKSTKKQKITKSLDELINEVFEERFEDFRLYLLENNVSILNLACSVHNRNLRLLGLALKGTKVTTVNLSRNQIKIEAARDFVQALEGTQVTTVDLSFNELGDAGAKDFGLALKDTQVLAVDISLNNIGDTGAIDFGLALKDTKVTTVDLSGNAIGDAGAKDFGQALKGSQVTTVELSRNKIGDAGARDFGKALTGSQVTTVDLGSNEIGDEGAKDFIRALTGTQVTTVDLRDNHIRDAGARNLAQNIEESHLLKLVVSMKNYELKKAIALNNRKLILTPFYAAKLKYLPLEEKQKFWGLTVDDKDEKPLEYAGGILMNPKLPEDIRGYILGFMPLMKTREGENQAGKYLSLANKLHQKIVKQKNNIRNSEIKLLKREAVEFVGNLVVGAKRRKHEN